MACFDERQHKMNPVALDFPQSNNHFQQRVRIWRFIISTGVLSLLLFWIAVDLWKRELREGDGYIVPLVDSYILRASDDPDPNRSSIGPYQLIRYADPVQISSWEMLYYLTEHDIDANSHSGGKSWCMKNVTDIFVRGHTIAGRNTSQYFVLNADSRELNFYDSYEKYTAALTISGISTVQLANLNEIERRLHPRDIRPWDYRFMDNYWGRSDVWWSCLMLDAGILISFVIGLAVPIFGYRKVRWFLRLATILFIVALALCLNILANYHQPGPDIFAGLFFTPAEYFFAAICGTGAQSLLAVWLPLSRLHLAVRQSNAGGSNIRDHH